MNWRLFLLIFLFPAFLAAQTALPVLPPVPKLELSPIPPGEDKIVPLYKGAEAPFSGQLFDSSTALRWGNYLEQYRNYHALVVDTQRKVYTLELQHQSKVLKLELEARDKVEADLKARLNKSEGERLKAEHEAKNIAWYNSRTFGVVIGVVATAGVFFLGAYAVGSKRD